MLTGSKNKAPRKSVSLDARSLRRRLWAACGAEHSSTLSSGVAPGADTQAIVAYYWATQRLASAGKRLCFRVGLSVCVGVLVGICGCRRERVSVYACGHDLVCACGDDMCCRSVCPCMCVRL